MTPKTLVARLFDIMSLVASNAFTACAAAVIALDTPVTAASKVLFSAGSLALYALIAILIYVGLAGMVWGVRLYQVRKLMIKAGYKIIPRLKEESTETITDPMLRMKVRQSEIKYYADMQSVCLGSSLMAAGILVAMYLSSTGTTPDGWPASKTALFAYLAPILVLIVFVSMGIWSVIKSRKLVSTTQKWIPISFRKPKATDFEPGFIPNTVLCRAPERLTQWGGNYYKVIEVKYLQKQLPPEEKREGIVWTLIPE